MGGGRVFCDRSTIEVSPSAIVDGAAGDVACVAALEDWKCAQYPRPLAGSGTVVISRAGMSVFPLSENVTGTLACATVL